MEIPHWDKDVKKTGSQRKWLLSITLIMTAALSLTSFVDQRAAEDYEQLFKRAFVTFAMARTINGIISVVQGTELALQPAGVGVTLTPGEILDPVNDLIERFSWIMLGATVSLGLQNVLLDISAWWLVQTLLAAMAVWMVFRFWFPQENRHVLNMILKRVFWILLFIRFAVPGMMIVNDFLYEQFLQSRFELSTQVITKAGVELEQLKSDAATEEPTANSTGLLDSMARAWSSTVNTLDLEGKLDRMRLQANKVIEHFIQLSVVFVLQTGLLPVLFLWVFLQIFKRLFRPLTRNRYPGS